MKYFSANLPMILLIEGFIHVTLTLTVTDVLKLCSPLHYKIKLSKLRLQTQKIN